MKKFAGISNYLVIKNGLIDSHSHNETIKIDNQTITAHDATSLQIIYLIDQPGSYSIKLDLQGELELIETYIFDVPCTLNKEITVLANSKILRYHDNQTIKFNESKVIEKVTVARDSEVKCAYVELANGNIEMQLNYDLIEENACSKIRLATLAKEDEKKHITLAITHHAPHTIGIMDNYGVVKGEANLVIDGIGSIAKGNYQSNSHQTNKIIVFDPACTAKANPYLYIDEYDVKASHGASVGKIDEEHLYYLQSRGLSKEDAMLLVTYGYFVPVLEFVENAELKELFNNTLKEKVGI